MIELRRLILLLPFLATPAFADEPASQPDARESQYIRDIVQLTTTFDRAGESYFSPDANWLIFQAAPKGQQQYQMYVAPVKWQGPDPKLIGLGTPVRISPDQSRNTCGWFSPDGKTILFSSTAGKDDPSELSPGYQRQGSRYQWSYPKGMEIFRAYGWQEQVEKAIAENPAAPAVNLATHPLTDNTSYDAECSFSPDGKSIVFCSYRTGDLELWVMNADGTDPRQLTHTSGYDGGPFFSPDGKKLCYRSDRAGNDLLQVYVAELVFDSAGRITGLANEKKLTEGTDVNWAPWWLNGGKSLIYASSHVGHTNYELFIVGAEGGEPQRITFTAGADVLPATTPDGRWLVWASKRTADKTVQIFAGRFTPPG